MKFVTLVGTSSLSRDDKALAASGGEVWGLNRREWFPEDIPFTRWFEIHVEDYLRKQTEHWEALTQETIPVYMQAVCPEIPASVRYPIEDVDRWMFARFQSEPYHTSTFSYMVALALMEGFDEIRLAGIDFYEAQEVYFERSGLEYLLGLARGSGVRVVLPKTCTLLHIAWPYGYEEPRIKLGEVEPFIAFLEAQIKDDEAAYDKLNGAVDRMPDDIGIDNFGEYLDARFALKSIRGSIRALKNAKTWLHHYGRGGCLLLPDGSVNE